MADSFAPSVAVRISGGTTPALRLVERLRQSARVRTPRRHGDKPLYFGPTTAEYEMTPARDARPRRGHGAGRGLAADDAARITGAPGALAALETLYDEAAVDGSIRAGGEMSIRKEFAREVE